MMTLFQDTKQNDIVTRDKFEQLIRDKNATVATWRLLWHQDASSAPRLLMEAMLACGWRLCVLFVQHALIESPVSPPTLWVGLKDGDHYDAREMIASFDSETSARVFKHAFPDWEVWGNGRCL